MGFGIRSLSTPVANSTIEGLVELLVDVVHAGASVSFMEPFTHDEAAAYWQRTLAAINPAVGPLVLVAQARDGRVAGTVQLQPAWPPNQPQRADIAKMLVHTGFRRLGIARRLMLAVEAEAMRLGRNLLTLDTVTGSPADRLYRSIGYVECGVIPRFALLPKGGWASTTIFYKQLPIEGDSIS